MIIDPKMGIADRRWVRDGIVAERRDANENAAIALQHRREADLALGVPRRVGASPRPGAAGGGLVVDAAAENRGEKRSNCRTPLTCAVKGGGEQMMPMG